jgi:ABC-2 type transport system permease protein
LDESAESATALRATLEAGDTAETRSRLRELDEGLETAGATGAALADLGGSFADDSTLSAQGEDARRRIEAFPLGVGSAEAAAQEAAEIESTVLALGVLAGELQSIDPAVLVSPFDVEAGVVGAVDLNLTDFYAPAVIALLLQHLAITFAALSLARERAFGTTELFAVAPLRVGETLIGKYIGYALIAGVVGGVLSLAMLTVFEVPLVGSVAAYAGVLALTMVASLGIGFVISTLVTSDTQAVNVAMIMLLLSIFFSGFFIDLFRLAPAVQIVSRLLPITYAIEGLRSVMFTGAGVPDQTWMALGAGSIILALLAWALMSWRLRTT